MKVMTGVPGVTDLAIYRSLGKPNVLITANRPACERYGLNSGEVEGAVQAAIGGQLVTQVLQKGRSFNLVVRWRKKFRTSLDAIRQIRVTLPGGGYVPLGQVATIRTAEGASFIYREGLERYVPVRFAVRGRDFEDAVRDAQLRVARQIPMPREVHLEWAGEWQEMRAANRRLAIIVPIALLLITGALYAATPPLSTPSSSWRRFRWRAWAGSWR
jgi:cobalt-zinc-cadmium resistance protein CzcA